MSVAVSTLCWRVMVPATEKLVLLCLADFADDTGACWPSIELVMERTGLGERCVREQLKRLEASGLLERERRVGQSALYRITIVAVSAPEKPAEEAQPAVSHRHEMPLQPAPDAGSTGTTCHFNRHDLPVQPARRATSYRTTTDPSLIHQRSTKRAGARDPVPDWVDPDVWAAFVDSRRAQRAPFTDRAAELIVAKLAQLRDTGQDPNACLLQSVERGWRGVFPVKPPPGGHREGDFRPAGKPSLVDRVARACDEWEAGLDVLDADDRDVRPSMDERARRGAESNVVEGHFRLVS